VHPGGAGEVATSGTGEAGAVQAVQAETGTPSAEVVDVSGDVEAKTITFTVSKDVIGSDIPNYRYIVVIGSQDGFGSGKWRDVTENPSTWTLGGGSNPAQDDGIDYDPNIIDVILEGDGQTAMLAGYDVAGHTYAQITGFEMPEVPQQIFGVTVDTVTSSTAVLTWSTTVADATAVRVAPVGQAPDASEPPQWTTPGTDHAVTLTGLAANVSYSVHLSANETDDVVVNFTTSNVVDDTPPELLNLAAEVLEDGRVTVTWYTSESATERILLNGNIVHEDTFATKKNHAYTTNVLGDGTYDLEVIGADASGNSNSTSISFTVDVGATVDTPDTNDRTDDDDTEDAAGISSNTLQLVSLIVVLLVLLAFLRVRSHGPEDEDIWK